MRSVLLLALSLLLGSCAAPGVPTDYKFNPSGTNGLVVGSITYDSFTGLYSVGWSSDTDANLQFHASVGYSQWPPLGREYDDALKAKGGTFAIEVPAGEYKVRRWFILQGVTHYTAAHSLDLPFVVEAGKVTYLGNVHFLKSDKVTLEDKSARDLPILKERYAAIGEAPVAFSIAAGTKIEDMGEGMTRRFDMPPIFMPVLKR